MVPMPSAPQRPADPTDREQHGRPAPSGPSVGPSNGHRGSSPPSEPAPEPATVDLGRAAWSITAIAFAVAGLVLLIKGYDGYASVTFAVAVAAAINLL